MAPTRLNLAALRRAFVRRATQSHDFAGDPFDNLLSRPVSRRTAIRVTGGAVVGLLPGLERLHVLLGGLELVGDDHRLAFVLGEQARWIIDTQHLAGRPKLRHRKRPDGSIRIDLKGARFPGTALPADFTCDVVPSLLGSEMRLELALGGFRCHVPLEAWLLDRARARSAVRLSTQIRSPGGGPAVALRGPAEAELFPDGTFRFNGRGIAAIAGLGRTLRSDSVTLAVADPAAESPLGQGPGPTTSLVLDRGTRHWRLRPSLPLGGHGRLGFPEEPFDRVSVLAVETGRQHGLAAIASAEGLNGTFWEPAGGLVDARGQSARLSLTDVRYAVAFGERGGQRSVMAGIDGPVWLHGQGFSVEVGDTSEEPALEIVETDGRLETVALEPELHRIVVPVPGAIVEPTEVAVGTRIALGTWSGRDRPPLEKDGDGPSATVRNGARQPNARVELDRNGGSWLAMTAAPPLALLRPEDLLSVAFQFVNLGLVVEGAGRARLVRESGQDAPGSFLVVHFQAQHITERAFSDPGEEPTGGDVPVEAITAARSRLAFRVPAETDELPYTLESLLDWTQLEPSLVAPALPPPPPILLVQALALQLGRLEVLRQPDEAPLPARIAPPSVLKAEPRVDPHARQIVSRELSRNVARGKRVSDEQLDAIAATLTQTRPGYRAIPQPDLERIIAKLLQRPYDPRPWETSIEAPWRLELSPNRFSAWAHATDPVVADWTDAVHITELWHTRLAVRRAGELEPGESPVDEREEYYRTLRAIWSPDYDRDATKSDPPHFPGSHPGNPFRMSLDARDRHELVTLTSDFVLPRCETRIVRAERFMLTALGAWMKVGGRWALNVLPPDAQDLLSVEEWRHRATMGRDQFVKVVYRGYLFPFGHAAALVKITERELQPGRQNLTAFLRQRFYVVVRQPEKDFPAAFQPHEGRKLPFRRARLVTLETPALDDPVKSQIAGKGQEAFWLQVANSDFLFHAVAEDLEGRPVEFTTPLAFIDGKWATDTALTQAAASSLAGSPARKTRPVQGQKVTYAETAKSGDTTFETDSLTFDAAVLTEPADAALRNLDQPRFWPGLEAAAVELPAVKRLTGASGALPIKYPQRYLEKGFAGGSGGNEGQVFAELVSAMGLGFGGGSAGTDKVGALVNPDLSISGLSRLSGPVSGDLQDMIEGSFDPQKFFAGLDAKILGGLSLRDIVQAVTSGLGPQLDVLKGELESTLQDLGEKLTTAAIESLPKSPVPAFITQLVYDDGVPAGDLENVTKLPKQIQLVFKWDPEVKEFETFRVDGDPKDTLSLTSVALIPLSPEGLAREPSYTVSASLQRFTLNLFGILAIKVRSVSFKKAAGDKPDVKADIDDIEFQGPLAFVEELQSVIPSDSFVSPDIDVLPTGIQAGIDLALPTIGTGVFTLADVSLGARLGVPFTGDPLRFRFNFCKREQPFVLTVYGLGGGGFFAIEMGLDGVELLEAALEFGAAIAVDFGVASGGVSVKAGIYFAMEADNALLTGYFRLAGHLDVLGLITASLVFYLALTWQQSPEMVWGEAMLTIEVEVLFFSASVSIKCRKEFTTPPPPSFTDLMTESEWGQYRLAFA
jgi:hypothetical protein